MPADILLKGSIDVALAVTLLWITREDLLRFRVPNSAIIGLGVSFVVVCLASGRLNHLISHALLSLTALIVLLSAFAVKGIGGGDAKLLWVALLWLGPEHTLVFALLLLMAVIAYAVGACFYRFPSRRANGGLQIPLGPCVGVAWIAVLGLSHSTC